MTAQVGTFSLMLGLTAALLGIIVLLRGIITHDERFLRLGRRFTIAIALAGIGAMGAMQYALADRDYRIKYVANNVANGTPRLFTITAAWSALEGSILLWIVILGLFLLGTAWAFRKRVADPLVAWATIVQYVVALFFFGLTVTVANPFSLSNTFIIDGKGPNPLLQNHPLVAFHPPFLYAGYVGMTIPFSFAIAALVTGRFGEGWLADTRRASMIAWGFLTVGIVLGAWWSYEVLGWGGYWGWDPVENASLLPWLTATAFIHSVMVQERRAMLRVWNLSLIIATFALTILGTFLTRSGVIQSVHTFSESSIGPALLTFFGLIVATGLGLIAWHGDRLRTPGRIDSVVSRESAFLLNNVIFAGFALVVLTGTVFPLLVEALQSKQLSVGSPYFETMTTPLGLALLFLMAVAPVLPWRATSTEVLRDRLFVPMCVGAVVVVAAVLFGSAGYAGVAAYGLGAFALAGIVRNFVIAVRAQGKANHSNPVVALARTVQGNPRRWGGLVVHVGVVCIAVAIAASQGSATQRELQLRKGKSATVAGHTITFVSTKTVTTAQKTTLSASFRLDRGGEYLGTYAPSISTFLNSTSGIGTPSVRSGFLRDIYLSLVAAPDDQGRVTVKVAVNPMIMWIWIGGAIMAFGTVLCLIPKRRTVVASTPAPVLAEATA